MNKWISFMTMPLLALMSFISCGDEKEEDYLNFVETELIVDSEGGAQIVGVSSNISWNAVSSVSWCALENSSGNGTGSIVLKIGKNTYQNDRVAKITLSGGYIKQELIVRQAGNEEKVENPEKEEGDTDVSIQVLTEINVEQGKTYYFQNKANEIDGYFEVYSVSGVAGRKVVEIIIATKKDGKRINYTLGDDANHCSYLMWDGTAFSNVLQKDAVANAPKIIFCLNSDSDTYTITSATENRRVSAAGTTETIFALDKLE